jgi:hypothetical protein
MTGKKEREWAENIKALQKNIELVDGDEIKQKIMEKTLGQTVEAADVELV